MTPASLFNTLFFLLSSNSFSSFVPFSSLSLSLSLSLFVHLKNHRRRPPLPLLYHRPCPTSLASFEVLTWGIWKIVIIFRPSTWIWNPPSLFFCLINCRSTHVPNPWRSMSTKSVWCTVHDNLGQSSSTLDYGLKSERFETLRIVYVPILMKFLYVISHFV